MLREDFIVGDDSSTSSNRNNNNNNDNNNNNVNVTTPHTIDNLNDFEEEERESLLRDGGGGGEEDNDNETSPLIVHSILPSSSSPLRNNNNHNNNMNSKTTTTSFKDTWFLYFSVCLSVLSTLEFGYNTGVISPTIIFIQTQFGLDTSEKSALVSIILVGCMIGCVASGWLVDKIGRRNTMVYNNIPYIIGPILATFSKNYAMLMIGRIITGFSVGIASAVVPTYISEVSPPQKRGALGLLRQSTITFGIMSASLIAYRLIHYNQGWRYMFLISITPSILQLLLCYWFVETPRWLLSKDRTSDAVQVLMKLDPTASNDQINSQIQKIYSNINQQKGDDNWLGLFKLKYFKVYLIGFGLSMFQQFVGINCVNYYSATILQDAGFKKDMAVLISGLIGTPQMIMMFGSIWLIDRFGRRPLLLISDVGMIVGLGVLGYSFVGTSGTSGHISQAYRAWLAVGGMVFYKLAFSVGMGPIPLMVASEIYPSKIRGKAMSIVSFLNWLANFIANITFLPIQEWVGQAGSYFIFAGVTLACLIFTHLWVPETKGVTIEELSKKLVKEDNVIDQNIN